MAHWRLRQSYGHGAARVPLAPVFSPSPYASAEDLDETASHGFVEFQASKPHHLIARVLGLGSGAVAAVFVLSLALAPLFSQPEDEAQPEIVLVTSPEPEEELVPEPPPLPVVEPEPAPPEPVKVAEEPPPPPPVVKPEPKPEPVRVAKTPPPPPPPPKMPEPIEPPPLKQEPVPAPVRVAREPVKRPPPVVSIDPLSPPPPVAATEAAPAPPPTRVAARTTASSHRPVPAPVDFAPIGDTAAGPGEAAPVTARAVRTNVVARPGSASKPVAFAALAPAAPPASYDEDATEPALNSRAPVQRVKSAPTSTARPSSVGFSARAPVVGETADESAPASNRSERAGPARATAAAPDDNLAPVSLASLAACMSDREEDRLKLELMQHIGKRTECRSRAGRYRFVETKNLNAFLMWIERAPSRAAVDRCIELRLAIDCLGG